MGAYILLVDSAPGTISLIAFSKPHTSFAFFALLSGYAQFAYENYPDSTLLEIYCTTPLAEGLMAGLVGEQYRVAEEYRAACDLGGADSTPPEGDGGLSAGDGVRT